MSSKKQMVSYTNEDAKDIHYYGKLREALKDYELMESIKALPDDMILEIKAYVISPYKYMAELKLYKCPTFINDSGHIKRRVFRTGHFENVPKYLMYEINTENTERIYYGINNVIQAHKLIADWNEEAWDGARRSSKIQSSNLIKDRAVINQMNDVYHNMQYENRQLLKDLNIKGRTKLIHELKQDMVKAIMKGS
jgi:hypothetical protein